MRHNQENRQILSAKKAPLDLPVRRRDVPMIEIGANIRVADAELRFSFSRSGGPGGQNVNKVSTRAILHWNVPLAEGLPESVRKRFLRQFATRINKDGDLVIRSDKTRHQKRNQEDCIARLREMLLQVATPPVKRRATSPGAGARQRRLNEKKRTSEKKALRRPPSRD